MKKYKWYLVLLGVVAILTIWLNISLYKIREYKKQEGTIVRDTTIVTKYDTIRITKPIYISQRVTDTIFIAIKDTLRINDTLYQIVPKTQKYYAKDSLYKAWVSGYKPNLDSLYVYPKTITNTITNTIYKKPSRIGFGIIGGYGINIGAEVKASPFIGAGIYYRIW